MALPVIWDAELCAAEVRRAPAKGVHSLTFTENPAAMGYPQLPRRVLEPVVEGLGRHRHGAVRPHRVVGPAGDPRPGLPDGRDDHPAADEHRAGRGGPVVVQPIKNYPDLKIALSEGGTGWIPYFLERVDRTYEMHSTWTGQDFGGKKPSRGVPRALPDLLHRRSRRREAAQRDRHRQHLLGRRLPAQRLDVAQRPRGTDEVLTENKVPDDEINKMTYENAMRWYSFDPFTHIAKEQATVGALRKAAEGHDVSIRARASTQEGIRSWGRIIASTTG